MNQDGQQILAHLATVDAERTTRASDPRLQQRVTAIKRFQHARFANTYRDLLHQPGYGAAVQFFLDDLYGPSDFVERDKQFARIVPALIRLFPAELVRTVRTVSELHALSESLDTRMARQIDALPIDEQSYARAWRATGEALLREQQVQLTLDVGAELWRHTRKLLLRQSLRAMRGPAALLGLAALHRFLQVGFETFGALPDADVLLESIADRERVVARELFAGG
ncbi:MAG TPA: hypothetical protein VIW70_06555 [Rubrivivax sp.]